MKNNMIEVKKIVNLLLEDKKLYDECGELFKYMGEVRINFSSLKEHNVPWQLTQILEITYSNKINGYDLDLFDVTLAYSTNHLKKELAKSAAWANFEVTFLISKIRKEKRQIDFMDITKIVNIINNHYSYEDDSNKINHFSDKLFSMETQKIYINLLNGTFANNALYFFPLFLYLTEHLIKALKHKHIIRSLIINLYLMKNKLLFAPTISFSYPLFYAFNEYLACLEEIDKNNQKIKDFSKLVFDLLKQSSVVSRAFISSISSINSKLKQLQENKKNKAIRNVNINNLLVRVAIDDKDNEIMAGVATKETLKDLINLLNREEMLVEIGKSKKYKVYLFKEYYSNLAKLNKNKDQKTTKIFILKENLN